MIMIMYILGLFYRSRKMSSAKLFLCLTALCTITFIDSTDSLKILGLFPHPGLSHFHFFHPIMRGLAEKGHDVTVISHFSDNNAPQHYKDVPLPKTDTFTNTVDLSVGSQINTK